MKSSTILFIYLIIGTLIWSLVAVSSDSLWIDELGTWTLTQAGSFGEWWTQFKNWHNSDTQIPLYHLLMFFWIKVAGTSEYALRVVNILFFVPAQIALIWPFRNNRRLALAFALVSAFCPFVWYYLNEARPYILVYLGASLMLSGLVMLTAMESDPDSQHDYTAPIALLSIGAVTLTGATILGAPWVFSAFVYVCVLFFGRPDRAWSFVKTGRIIFPVAAVFLALIVFHDVQTFLGGAKAVQRYKTSISSLGFMAYETLGLDGLGPGRLALRDDFGSALKPYLPIILPGSVLVIAVFLVGFLSWFKNTNRTRAYWTIVCGVGPIALVVVAGILLHWRVLGRHIMPTIPLMLLIQAAGVSYLIGQRNLLAKLTGYLFVIVTALSSVSLATRQVHKKDDYRTAAHVANCAIKNGQRVWWGAAAYASRYYQIPLKRDEARNADSEEARGSADYIFNDDNATLAALPLPDVIVLSKPDAFDSKGAVARLIRSRDFDLMMTLPAFTVYARGPVAPACFAERR